MAHADRHRRQRTVLAAVGFAGIRRRPRPHADGCLPLAATRRMRQGPHTGQRTHTIQSSGKSRSFILRVPANYNNSNPYRLIFAFHWRGGTMNDVASGGTSGTAWSYYGMQEQSNNSAILVAPRASATAGPTPAART